MNVADWTAASSYTSWFVNLISAHRVKSNYLWCLVFSEASGALTTTAQPHPHPSASRTSYSAVIYRWADDPYGTPSAACADRVCLLTSVTSTTDVWVWEGGALKGRAIYCDTKEALIGRVCSACSLAVSGRVNWCVIGGAARRPSTSVHVTSYIGRAERLPCRSGRTSAAHRTPTDRQIDPRCGSSSSLFSHLPCSSRHNSQRTVAHFITGRTLNLLNVSTFVKPASYDWPHTALRRRWWVYDVCIQTQKWKILISNCQLFTGPITRPHVSITSSQFASFLGQSCINCVVYDGEPSTYALPLPERCIFEQVIFDRMSMIWWPWSLTFWPQNLTSSSMSRAARKLQICVEVVHFLKAFYKICSQTLAYDHTRALGAGKQNVIGD